MKVTFLGTGASQGIPVIGLNHPLFESTDSRDRRLRSSILLEQDGVKFLVDCGPDLRTQLLNAKCKDITAIFITHEHADHTSGFDELRGITNFTREFIPLYTHPRVLSEIKSRFSYAFGKDRYYSAPKVTLKELLEDEIIIIQNITVTPILVNHGHIDIYGYRFNDLVYISDIKQINEQQLEKIMKIDTLIIGALQMEPHSSHLNLNEALEFIKVVEPKKVYLTHISHKLGFHEEVSKMLPEGVELAYDGLQIKL